MQSKLTKNVRRQKVVLIDDPRGLPGASFFTLIAVGFHYIILSYLFLSGRYYNTYRAPTFLFIIPSFIVAGTTVLGLLCYVLQNHRLVRKLCEPSTGLPITIIGILSGAAYCFVVYGTLYRDFFQGYMLLETGLSISVYFLLVSRRLAFACVAFVEGAKAVSQLKIMWFRTLIFALCLLAYICVWSVLYVQLIEDPNLASSAGSLGNSTALTPTYIPIPQWIMYLNSRIPISKPGLRTAGKAFLGYNLLVVSQTVKIALWMSISSVVSDLSDCVNAGCKLEVQPLSELTYRAWQSLPSIIFAGHTLLISQFLESIAEGFRRCPARRSGITYNLGSALLFLSRPLVSRVSIYGICRMQHTKNNIVRSSLDAANALSRCGLRDAINSDLLCGTRLCEGLLLACAGSVVSSTLVTIFSFPASVSHELALVTFLAVFLAGNWGIECAEVWACALYLEFASAPDIVYIAAPRLALGLHTTLFGCPRLPHQEAARRVRKRGRAALLACALAAWRDVQHSPAVSSASLSPANEPDSRSPGQSYHDSANQQVDPEEVAASGTESGMQELNARMHNPIGRA